MTEPAETVKKGVLDFFRGRLHHHLVTQDGYASDIVEAALAAGIAYPVDAVSRVKALAAFTQREDFEGLAMAFKRVGNIIKEGEPEPVQSEAVTVPAERELFEAYRKVEAAVREKIAQGDYDGALESLTDLRRPIDAFFEAVLVMDPDPAVRRNRLALLTAIHELFNRIADFRKVQTG